MMHLRIPSLLSALCLLLWGATTAAAQEDDVLLWSSTGGGWRAMFADVGYANLFKQAGLMTPTSTRFSGIATVSGGSWFSTQLFYSSEFYNQTVLAETPEQLEEFVTRWMGTYYNISTNVDEETKSTCDASVSGLTSKRFYDPESDVASVWYDICVVLVKYDEDWAFFVQSMMDAGAKGYGDAAFVDQIARPENRIEPVSNTDLLIQSALVPNSRIRESNTAVYLGYGDQGRLFTVPLSAAWVVEDSGAKWWYGTEDRTSQLQTYLAQTPAEFTWSDWVPFFLYPGEGGTIEIDNTQESIGATLKGDFQDPFGGTNAATAVQVASASSAAGGNGSPLVPSVYTQVLSMGRYEIEEKRVSTVWRVLAGIAAGLGTGFIIWFGVRWLGRKWCPSRESTPHIRQSQAAQTDQSMQKSETPRTSPICESTPPIQCAAEDTHQMRQSHAAPAVPSRKYCNCKEGTKWVAIGLGAFFGLVFGLITGFVYGIGSGVVPNVYDEAVDGIYSNSNFDNFAVCSQWPQSCSTQDGFLIDGWFIDNPAVVINVAHHQRRGKVPEGKPMKVIITNTNQEWDTTYNRAQILQYFSTYFNTQVTPGGFLWAPGYWAPYRSPQIFSEYIDEAGLDAKLEPIPDSNMTTAFLEGTTMDNPSFGVVAGQKVEMLLLNLNVDITTFVIGREAIEKYTQPLAEMTSHIASNEVLLQRVIDFVGA